jgi:hypothetical protein
MLQLYTPSVAHAIYQRMACYLLKNDLEKTRVEAVAVHDEVRFAYMAQWTEENYENLGYI